MVELTLWKDQEMKKLKKDMDHLFNRIWSDFSISRFPAEIMRMPSMEVSETKDMVVVTGEFPGIKPEDLFITLTERRLTISGRRAEESMDEVRMERRVGSFTRSLMLPCKVRKDAVKATYRDGTLRIEMPKSEPDTPQAVKIDIK